MAWRWTDPEETIATNDEGVFAPVGAIELEGESIGPYQRWPSLEGAKTGRHAELAHRRWLAEQDFSFGGAPISMDDGTQRRIAGAIQYLQLSGETSVRWQVARGVFTAFSAAQLNALGVAVGAHVQACFANVETLSAEIEACETIAEIEAVDIEAGWPS